MDLTDLVFFHSHKIQMMFYPDAWRAADDTELNWVVTDFPPVPRSEIPQSSGVYAFVVVPDLFSLYPANGLFYVGKATNLYNRIGAYISENNKEFAKSKRPHIWKMLNQWEGCFKYYYSTTDNVTDAENIEIKLLNAFMPPFNKQYPAETSQIIRAFP